MGLLVKTPKEGVRFRCVFGCVSSKKSCPSYNHMNHSSDEGGVKLVGEFECEEFLTPPLDLTYRRDDNKGNDFETRAN